MLILEIVQIFPVEHEWKKDTKSLNSSGNYGGQRLIFNKVVCVNRKTEFKALVVKAVSSSSALPPPPPGQSGKNDWKVFRKSKKSKGVSINVVAEGIASIFAPFRIFVVMILCLFQLFLFSIYLMYVVELDCLVIVEPIVVDICGRQSRSREAVFVKIRTFEKNLGEMPKYIGVTLVSLGYVCFED